MQMPQIYIEEFKDLEYRLHTMVMEIQKNNNLLKVYGAQWKPGRYSNYKYLVSEGYEICVCCLVPHAKGHISSTRAQ